MNNLLKGMLLGGVSVCLANIVYKKGVSDGFDKGKQLDKHIDELETIFNIMSKLEESKTDEETENK